MWQPSAKNGPFQGFNIYCMKDMQSEKQKDGTLHSQGRQEVGKKIVFLRVPVHSHRRDKK
jgi:hypothetical protein